MLFKRLVKKALLKHYIRLKNHRRNQYLRHLYQLERERYYKHATVLVPENQSSLVSIIVPCFDTPAKYFEPLLSSVFAQGYENWELVLVDASPNKHKSVYIKEKSKSDTRIKYVRTVNEGIALNTNKGIEAASGKYIAFLDHDDTLDPDALAESVAVLEIYPEFGLVYSDEDKISEDGSKYFNPHYKPGFSLDMLRNLNYITHFVVLRKEIADKLGGIRAGFDGAQDYDFLLRVVDEGVGVAHIPKILYHWREAEGSTAADFSVKKNVLDAGCKALDDHYERNNIKNVKARAIENRPGYYRPEYDLEIKRRAIIVDLSHTKLNNTEKQYIYDTYKQNKDIQKHKIQIKIDQKKSSNHDTVMTVTQPIIPLHQNVDIASMFALAEEGGVRAVMPKVTKHGRIEEMGTVGGYEEGRLFANLAVDRNDFFGSLEWVRNVDEIKGGVRVACTNVNETDTRNVVWVHSEFSLYDVGSRLDGARPKGELTTFNNPNVANIVNTTQRTTDYIIEEIEG